MKLEVLCATMKQHGFQKINEMKIHSDVIFANQSNRNEYNEYHFDGYIARMITTDTIGVGINRNIALSLSCGDILLFSDDDIIYSDDYERVVLGAFEEIPQADVIIFGLKYTQKGEVVSQKLCKTGRLKIVKSLRYGTAAMAIRRSSLLKANVAFSQLFGGGCIYGSGEDSLFILNCFKKGLKLYTYDYCLGTTARDTSSWFVGYNEKYFYDKGAWVACAFPKTKNLLKWYFCARFLKLTDLKFFEILKQINAGIKGFKSLTPYMQ